MLRYPQVRANERYGKLPLKSANATTKAFSAENNLTATRKMPVLLLFSKPVAEHWAMALPLPNASLIVCQCNSAQSTPSNFLPICLETA
jgi:hypothetical protein